MSRPLAATRLPPLAVGASKKKKEGGEGEKEPKKSSREREREGESESGWLVGGLVGPRWGRMTQATRASRGARRVVVSAVVVVLVSSHREALAYSQGTLMCCSSLTRPDNPDECEGKLGRGLICPQTR